MYDTKSVNSLAKWIDSDCPNDMTPPLEKKYWWNLELDEKQKVTSAEYARNRFDRCCLHWSSVVKTISQSFSTIADTSSCATFKLEDIVSDHTILNSLIEFLDLNPSNFYFDFLQKPRNVFLPLEFNCTSYQLSILKSHCEGEARTFGYDLCNNLSSMTY